MGRECGDQCCQLELWFLWIENKWNYSWVDYNYSEFFLDFELVNLVWVSLLKGWMHNICTFYDWNMQRGLKLIILCYDIFLFIVIFFLFFILHIPCTKHSSWLIE